MSNVLCKRHTIFNVILYISVFKTNTSFKFWTVCVITHLTGLACDKLPTLDIRWSCTETGVPKRVP